MSHWDFLEEYPKNKLHKALLDTIGTYENDTNNDPTILGYDHLAPRGDGRSSSQKGRCPAATKVQRRRRDVIQKGQGRTAHDFPLNHGWVMGSMGSMGSCHLWLFEVDDAGTSKSYVWPQVVDQASCGSMVLLRLDSGSELLDWSWLSCRSTDKVIKWSWIGGSSIFWTAGRLQCRNWRDSATDKRHMLGTLKAKSPLAKFQALVSCSAVTRTWGIQLNLDVQSMPQLQHTASPSWPNHPADATHSRSLYICCNYYSTMNWDVSRVSVKFNHLEPQIIHLSGISHCKASILG